MARAEDFADIGRWAKRKLYSVRRFLPFARATSHDTLNDGAERAAGAVVLGVLLVATFAIPRLLERLELQGALATIDATGCQRETAQAIRAKGADYLLALKDNWPTWPMTRGCPSSARRRPRTRVCRTGNGDRDRIETRRCRVSQNLAWLSTSRRFPSEWRFPGLATPGMIEAEMERDDKTPTSRRYYLSSAPLNAEQFAAAVYGQSQSLNEIPDRAFLKTRRKTLGLDGRRLRDARTQP